jgi:hypothetical protein
MRLQRQHSGAQGGERHIIERELCCRLAAGRESQPHKEPNVKIILITIAVLSITASAAAQSSSGKPQACWFETSAVTMDGTMGGAGLRDTKVWDSTVSVVVVRHAKGDVLIDGVLAQTLRPK